MRRLLLAFALCLLGTAVYAHMAPSGWMYDQECCGNGDCHEIVDTAVTENSDGSYTVNVSKEKWYAPGHAPMVDAYSPEGGLSKAKGHEYRWSKDEHFHRCSPGGLETSLTTWCLYVPQPSI